MKHGQELLDELKAHLEATKQTEADRDDRLYRQEMDLDDCFLSRHCGRLTQMEIEMKIEILEAGGLGSFMALFDLDGNLLADRLIKTRYGVKFRTPDGKWVDPWPKREATLTKKGYRIGQVQRPAWVAMMGDSIATVRPGRFQSDTNYWTGEKA